VEELLAEKLDKLKAILNELGSVAIGFSGGVDSTFLLKVAVDTLGEKALAVTAEGPVYAAQETRKSTQLAKQIGARQILFEQDTYKTEPFAENPEDRCYHCKSHLFDKIRTLIAEQGVANLIDGSNLDDLGDYRPGRKALEELGVRSPLVEAGLSKAEIRAASKELGLPTWDDPAMACLASRFPYGTRITPERLAKIEAAEAALAELGFHGSRVRFHGDVARIEVPAARIDEFLDEKLRETVVAKVKAAGFAYVALDLSGYRTGSMNEVLSDE
jgi:pyridinium-3,5-biscarboxylic acid mononucleotide sulfurtransferase